MKTKSGSTIIGKFNFTTGNLILPMVSIISPNNSANGVTSTPNIELKFSESVNNFNTSTIILHEGSPTGPTTTISNIKLNLSNSYVFNPHVPLFGKTTYYIEINNIADNESNQLVKTTFNFTTRAIQYTYVTNYYGNNVTICQISSVDGSLNNCLNSSLLEKSSSTNLLDGPTGIILHNGYTYINNLSGNSITICQINSKDGNLTNCSNNLNDNSIYLYSPVDSALSNNYAYIANYDNNNVTICKVSSINGGLTNCSNSKIIDNSATSLLDSPQGVVINNGYIYFTNSGSSNLTICKIHTSDGSLNDCYNYLPKNNSTNLLGAPTGLTINKNYAYISNWGPFTKDGITICKVSPTGGDLSDCYDFEPKDSNDPLAVDDDIFTGPLDITINDGYAYITNWGNNITVCQVNSTDGSLSKCSNYNPGILNFSYGIAIN